MDYVFDLDGTICFNGEALSKTISEKLITLQSQGNRVIIASARPIRDIYPVLPEHMHTLDMIGGNGSFIKKDGIISITPFLCLEELIKIIIKHRLSYLADSTWDYAYTGPYNHPIRKNVDPGNIANDVKSIYQLTEVVKLVLFTDNKQIIEELKKLPIELHIHSGENIVDISPLHINKWSGLQKIGIKEKKYIVFGNDTNDIEMFKNARESICVGNHPVALKYATRGIQPHSVSEELDFYIKKTNIMNII